MRLFVALEVPESWREAAARATDEIGRASGVRLRAVHPSLLHLTLRFLGEVPEERVEALIRALREAVTPFDVELGLGRAGTFGPPARTQVVWLGVTGDLEGLQALATRVEGAVRAAGLPPAERAPRVHLTLARLGREPGAAERREVAEAVRQLEAPASLAFRAREVVLMRSTLGGPRPMYEVVGQFG